MRTEKEKVIEELKKELEVEKEEKMNIKKDYELRLENKEEEVRGHVRAGEILTQALHALRRRELSAASTESSPEASAVEAALEAALNEFLRQKSSAAPSNTAPEASAVEAALNALRQKSSAPSGSTSEASG